METKFNFKSQICTTREQSERLIALGLKKETADMCWQTTTLNGEAITYPSQDVWLNGSIITNNHFPAWSLHRLIEMMPKCVLAHSSGDDSPRLHPYVPKFDNQGVTIENIDETLAEFYAHADLFNNICDAIEWLIKEGYFNKEYLE